MAHDIDRLNIIADAPGFNELRLGFLSELIHELACMAGTGWVILCVDIGKAFHLFPQAWTGFALDCHLFAGEIGFLGFLKCCLSAMVAAMKGEHKWLFPSLIRSVVRSGGFSFCMRFRLKGAGMSCAKFVKWLESFKMVMVALVSTASFSMLMLWALWKEYNHLFGH